MIDHTTLQPGDTFRHSGVRKSKHTSYVVVKVSPECILCHDEDEKGADNKTLCFFPAPFWRDKEIDKNGMLRYV